MCDIKQTENGLQYSGDPGKQTYTPSERIATGPYTPRLNRYFPIQYSPPAKCSFLELPVEVRQRIYKFTDLVRKCPIELDTPIFEPACQEADDTFSEEEDEHTSFYDTEPDDEIIARQCRCLLLEQALSETGDYTDFSDIPHFSECKPVSTALLLTCRQVYLEALPTLYGGNAFHISASRTSLWNLRSLGYRALSNITSLLLDVDVEEQSLTHSLLQQTVDLFANHLNSPLLKLSVVVSNVDNASLLPRITQTLTNMPLTLNAAIRINGAASTDPSTKEHIKTTLRTMTTKDMKNTSFEYFSHLPYEVQVKIISFAAVPSTDRSFRAQSSGLRHNAIHSGSLLWTYNPHSGIRYNSRSCGHIVHSGCCGKCQPTIDPDHFRLLVHENDEVFECFCPQKRQTCMAYDPDEKFCYPKTYGRWSTTCRCQNVPTSLFLVNRDFAHLAQTAFYANTRFIITTLSGLRWSDQGYYCGLWFDCQTLEFFLNCVPVRHLTSIRYIQIRVRIKDEESRIRAEHFSIRRAWPGGPSINYLSDFFACLMRRLDFGNLTLAVHVANRWTENGFEFEKNEPNGPMQQPPLTSFPALQESHALTIRRLATMMKNALHSVSSRQGFGQASRLKDLQLYTTSLAGLEFNDARQEMEAQYEQYILGDQGRTRDFERKVEFAPQLQWLPGYEKHVRHLFCMPGLCIAHVDHRGSYLETQHWW